MPIYSVRGPDGRIYDVEGPAGASEAQIVAFVKQQIAAQPKPKEGLGAAFGKGIESLLSATRTGVKGIYAPEEAAREGRAREEDIQRRYAEQVSLDKVKQAYEQRGLLSAAGEVASQIPAALAEQAPNIAATLGSARLGAMAGAPFGVPGAIVGGLAGAVVPSLFQQAGSNIQRQAAEGQPISRAAAYGAAVPQAALDVASTFIPLGRTLVGKALGPGVTNLLERGFAEGAEKLAKETLLKTLGKGTAVGALAEIPTEVTQQMLERLQAGLPVLSEDALKEYGETAYQTSLLAPIGAAGRVAERGAARERIEAREELQREQATKARREQEKAAAAAAEAQKQTPEYAARFMQQHETLQKEYDDLGDLLKQKLPPGASFAEKQTFEAQKKRRGELKAELSKQAAEYNRVKRLVPAAPTEEEQRLAALTPMEYQLEQAGVAPITVRPGDLRMPTPSAAAAPEAPRVFTGEEEITPTVQAANYAQARVNLANDQAFVDEMDVKDRPAFYTAYLMQDPAMAQVLVANDVAIPGLKKRESNAVLGALKLQLGAREEQTKAEEAARKARDEARAAQQEQARKAFEAAPAMQQDIAGFQRSMGDVVPQREFEFTPQVNELLDRMAVQTPYSQNAAFTGMVQQLKAAPVTLQLDKLNAKIREVETQIAETGGTDADKTQLANMQKAKGTLEKLVYRKLFDLAEQTGQDDLLKRVDTFKPTGEARRAKGEFRLFGEAETTPREITREVLQERLTRAMASNKLSDDAYEFLSRVEATLPETDRDGIFGLVDQQLQRIESGAEGMARPGAGRKTTLQAFPAEGRADVTGATLANAEDMARQYLFQQKVAEGMKPMQARELAFKATVAELAEAADATRPDLARTLREGTAAVTKRPARDIGKKTLRGPSAKAEPLSLQEELEPLIQQIERAREEDMGQMALFPSEQKKVAITRATPGEFQQFLGSERAQKLRRFFEPAETKVARARKKLDDVNARIAELNGTANEIEAARADAFPFIRLNRLREELATLEARPRTKLGELAESVSERIGALREAIRLAEEQETKLIDARAKLKAGDIKSLKNEFAAVQKDFGSVLQAVARRGQLKAAINELQLPVNSTNAFIDTMKISDEDKRLLKEQLADKPVNKHLASLNTQFADINKALDRIDAVVRVSEAERKVREYEAQKGGDRTVLAMAKRELRAAQTKASSLKKEIGVREARSAAQEGAQRRAAAAINRAEQELKRTEKYKAEQAALERAQKAPEGVDKFGQPLRSLIREPITAAQRAAREDDTPTILADEMRQVRGNPQQVLKGYRAYISTITKKLQEAYDTARQQTAENVKERAPYEAALAAYRSTIASESPELRALEAERRELIDKANKDIKDPVARAQEYDSINADISKRRDALPGSKNVGRANLEPRLAKLEKAYNDAVTNALNARVMPKGLVGYQDALTEMLRREAWLSNLIDQGTVEVVEPPKPRKRKTEAELKEIQAVLQEKDVKESVARLGAPEIDVTAKTKTEIEQARKPKGTLYSAKGVGQETLVDEKEIKERKAGQVLLQQKLTPEQRATYESNTIIKRAMDKVERKETLDPLEEMLLGDYKRSRLPNKAKLLQQNKFNPNATEEEIAAAEGKEEPESIEEIAEAEREAAAVDTEAVEVAEPDIAGLFDVPSLPEETLEQLAATASQGPALKEEVDTEESAAAVANNLSETGSTEIARAVSERLKLLLGNTRVEIVDDLRDPDGQAAYGQAAADGSFIRLDSRYGLNERTFIHEGVHAATERVIQMPEDQLTPDQLRAKRELEELFEAYKKLPNATNENAKASLSEFASEALSDDMMQAEMRAQKWTLRHMWDSFKSAILRMLGVKTPENMLDATLAAVDNLMTKVPRPTAADNALLSPKVLNRPVNLNPALAEADAVARQMVAGNQSWWQTVRAKSTGLAMETALVDRFASFERLAKYMPKLQGAQMMYYLRMYDQRMNFVAQSVANGALDIREVERRDGEPEFLVESVKGPSLKEVVQTLKRATPMVGDPNATSRLFTQYLAARRAERVGFDKLNLREPELTAQKLRETVAQIKAVPGLQEVFDDARDTYNEYNQNLVRFAQKAGVFTQAQADMLLKDKDYIPWYRDRNGVAELAIGGLEPIKLGNIKDMPHLQELVGGDKPILDFTISSVQNTNTLVDMSLRNLATRNAMLELLDLGLAKVTPKPVSGTNVVRFKIKGDDRYAILDTETIEVNGKKIETGVPAEVLVKGMEGIPVQTTGLMRAMTIPTQFLRRAVTLNPLYMVRQLMRDSLAATIATGADFIPVLGALKEINSATKSTLEKRGITGGQVFTGGVEDLSKVMRDLIKGETAIGKTIGAVEWMGMEADALTRRAQYNSYIKQGMSEMEATLLALESMNFNKRGAAPLVHTANALLPFFNAQIQGLNVLYKAMFGQITPAERVKIRQKLFTRGAMLMAATLAYAHSMQDDEAYKNALPAEKYNNWFVRLPFFDEPVRIPIPFEVGYIFKALPEAIYNTIVNERGAEEAKEALLGILRNVVPGGSSYFIPQAMKPALEVLTNYSMFTERPMMSAKEQGLLPEYQYRDSTTQLAKLFGGALGVSPIKIDALVNGYFSTMGMAAMQLASLPIPAGDTPEKATRRMSELPVVGSAFQPNDARWIINSTYDALEDARKTQASYKELVNRGEKAEARTLLDRRASDFAQAQLAGYYRQQMGLITQYEGAVRASDKTPDEKRALLDKARQMKIKLSNLARQASDAAKLRQEV